jgi:hypothetical protein
MGFELDHLLQENSGNKIAVTEIKLYYWRAFARINCKSKIYSYVVYTHRSLSLMKPCSNFRDRLSHVRTAYLSSLFPPFYWCIAVNLRTVRIRDTIWQACEVIVAGGPAYFWKFYMTKMSWEVIGYCLSVRIRISFSVCDTADGRHLEDWMLLTILTKCPWLCLPYSVMDQSPAQGVSPNICQRGS